MRSYEIKTREGSVLNPRFPAPVNTYNATVHAMVEALFDALSHVVPARARADGCGSRSIIIGGGPAPAGKTARQNGRCGGGGGGGRAKKRAPGTAGNEKKTQKASPRTI